MNNRTSKIYQVVSTNAISSGNINFGFFKDKDQAETEAEYHRAILGDYGVEEEFLVKVKEIPVVEPTVMDAELNRAVISQVIKGQLKHCGGFNTEEDINETVNCIMIGLNL